MDCIWLFRRLVVWTFGLLELGLVFFGEDLWDGGGDERLLVACKLIGKLVSVCITVGVGDFRFRVSDEDGNV